MALTKEHWAEARATITTLLSRLIILLLMLLLSSSSSLLQSLLKTSHLRDCPIIRDSSLKETCLVAQVEIQKVVQCSGTPKYMANPNIWHAGLCKYASSSEHWWLHWLLLLSRPCNQCEILSLHCNNFPYPTNMGFTKTMCFSQMIKLNFLHHLPSFCFRLEQCSAARTMHWCQTGSTCQ